MGIKASCQSSRLNDSTGLVPGRDRERTGREIGVKAGDRYERDSRSAPHLRHAHDVAIRTNAILTILADMARGGGTEVSL